jgi:hypothetical protein
LPLSLSDTRLYARQLALPEVGAEGMERLRAATVVVTGAAQDLCADTAQLYLRAAGVGQVTRIPPPRGLDHWKAALAPAGAALHFALDDDGALSAAEAAGVPLLVGRVHAGAVELISFRRHRRCGHASPAVTTGASAARDSDPGAAAVVLATLAANEVLFVLLGARSEGPAAQLLRLPLDGGPPARTELPWPRPCPVCDPKGMPA